MIHPAFSITLTEEGLAVQDAVAIIPARYASSRLPGKPLLAETGKPLIQHVVEATRRCRRLRRIIVATDDIRIAEAVRAFGGEVAMTCPDHPSGTDRVAEVARALPEAQIIVNVQGDEPEIEPFALDRLLALMEDDVSLPMATLATPIHDESIFLDPACVKVVCSSSSRALYFSRSPIPGHRDGHRPGHPWGLLHLGLYAYRRDFLLGLSKLAPSRLEQTEKLEQLRVLEAGYAIAVGIVDEPSVGIDTPEDYRRFVQRCRQTSAGQRVA
jgi:3-deoxy-manno-octulosonate cytidylyltransferase (CMP-KDO synthetase)